MNHSLIGSHPGGSSTHAIPRLISVIRHHSEKRKKKIEDLLLIVFLDHLRLFNHCRWPLVASLRLTAISPCWLLPEGLQLKEKGISLALLPLFLSLLEMVSSEADALSHGEAIWDWGQWRWVFSPFLFSSSMPIFLFFILFNLGSGFGTPSSFLTLLWMLSSFFSI